MKTLIILFFMPLLAFGQQKIEVVDNTFYTTIKDGRGKNVNISFTISPDAREAILASDSYAATSRDSSFIAKNKDLRGIDDVFTLHLFSMINSAVWGTTNELKNKTSFTVEEGTQGMIYISKGNIAVSFPFSGQNGLGNMVYGTSITINGKTLIANE